MIHSYSAISDPACTCKTDVPWHELGCAVNGVCADCQGYTGEPPSWCGVCDAFLCEACWRDNGHGDSHKPGLVMEGKIRGEADVID